MIKWPKIGAKKDEPKKPRRVKRFTVMQAFLNFYEAPRYLEIGVSKGTTFHGVTAASKVAVDPVFRFDTAEAAEANPGAVYHRVTSDHYFGTIRPADDIFDVVYLDGLHTSDQILRDFMNAILCTHEKSVIVIDDVRPSNYGASLKHVPDARATQAASNDQDQRSWMGDVYKIVQFIETFAQGFSYAEVKGNHGQLVVWRKARPSVIEMELEAVARAPFETLFSHPAHQKQMELEDIRQLVEKDLFGR